MGVLIRSIIYLERIFWLHQHIKQDLFPNVSELAHRFEISFKTAQRTITHFRDRLGAPIEYDRGRKGYYYTQEFEFPLARLNQEEVLALLLAESLLQKSAGGYISQVIRNFTRKIISQGSQLGLTWEKMQQAFSVVWTGYSPAQAETFARVAQALLEHLVLSFDYTSPAKNQTAQRIAEPHHMQHYMGSWVLIAWCQKRQDWRKFYLSRMTKPQVTAQNFVPRPQDEWQYQVEDNFGIFQNRQSIWVVLRFNAFRAGWIREQIWHPNQVQRELAGGCLELALPVADFREIKLKILSFGADVVVVSPESLRREVAAEIAKMGRIYTF